MGSEKTVVPPLSTLQWVSWFKDGIVPPDLDDEVVQSFLRHLADLEVLVPCGEGEWKFSSGADSEPSPESLRKILQGRLEVLSQTEEGFAVGYFLLHRSADPRPIPIDSGVQPPSGISMPEKASDLSNLQIVKKVGRQLKPFLEQEKIVLSRLQGVCTGKEDAQRIFHYIFSQTREKAGPRKWEQISRKRHR